MNRERRAPGLRLAAILLRWGGYRSRQELFDLLWETAEAEDASRAADVAPRAGEAATHDAPAAERRVEQEDEAGDADDERADHARASGGP